MWSPPSPAASFSPALSHTPAPFVLAASLGPLPASDSLVLAGAVVLLLVSVLLMSAHRRRERRHLGELREREEKLRLALWASNEHYWDYDLDRGVLESTSIEGEGNLRASLKLEDDHRIHPDDIDAVRERLRQHLRGQTPMFLSEHRVRSDIGEWRWMSARGRAIGRDPDGRVRRIAGTACDVTSMRSKERERRIAAEVMHSMAESVVVVDDSFRFVTVNPAFARMTGYQPEDVVGKDASLLNSEQHDPAFYQQSRQAMQHGPWAGEMWQRRKDGQEILCAVQANAVQQEGTEQRLCVLVATDITDRRRIEQELRYLANYDTLTNLPNRTLLAERLSRAIVRARRQGTCVALLFLDLDRFKDVNDSLGHATGDRILRIAAQRLQEVVGPSQTVARIGGDEFTVVLEDVAHAGEADVVAQRVIDAFDAPLLLDDRQELVITPSIGISLYPDHAQVPTDLLKHADTAMYQAKAAGRRTFMRYADAMDSNSRRRAGMVASLRRVVERRELRLEFQPKLSLADGCIVGVEALLRWDSAEHGSVAPAHFIPLAEESGVIVPIGEWVLREACNTLAAWQATGLEGIVMAVNVSAVQLVRSDLPRTVERILRETGVDARHLELELTESVLMANADSASERLQTFRTLGVAIAVDDFGTGYSSLAYLRRLPITTLKIDKAFIDDLGGPGDTEDAAITTTVIAMAHSLGLNVVAEGVETPEQLAFLRQHGCDIVQGYWLSRPLAAAACLRFIRDWPQGSVPDTGEGGLASP